MINRRLFAEVNGCVSTGKEANVYHAARADGTECAIKVWFRHFKRFIFTLFIVN